MNTKTKRFTARAAFVGEVDEFHTFAVVLGEHEDGAGMRLEIQRAAAFDERDREARQDTYCLSDERGVTLYGGIDGWSLADDLLTIALDERAREMFDVEDFEITLAQRPDTRLEIEQGIVQALEREARSPEISVTTRPNLACRVCGLLQDDEPWGADGRSPTFAICDCCGTEFGYEDISVASIHRARERWMARGAGWRHPQAMPPGWSREAQMPQIPLEYR